jgi:hypothetical protein
MKGFLWGTIFGVVVATVGFSGLAAVADWGLDSTKVVLKETAVKAEEAKAQRAAKPQAQAEPAKQAQDNTEKIRAEIDRLYEKLEAELEKQ